MLEEREVAARQRVESLQGELARLVAGLEEAEAARDRLVIAKETVSQVLSEAGEPRDVEGDGDIRPVVPGPVVARVVPGSVVPVRREGLDVSVLSPDYQRIMHVLAGRERSGEGLAICRQLADALDLELVPAKIEGGAVQGEAPGRAGLAHREHPGLLQHRRFARRRLMTVIMDQSISAVAGPEYKAPE
ncbi:hypothetical protein ACFVRD_48540 [Streptomyces sp. NPDC057908]|uniref:hypothetical protein n=1 Tax=Streptomyces sp. NPDC057908 TaxID=3346276 RepID=UPI0036E923DC